MPRVPTTTHVIPGALVNIVLKADQPTGRTVTGTVSTLLTRGNHPRGIKVRLTDGRVGRVQSMAEAGQPTSASASFPDSRSDMRTASYGTELPSEHVSLDAYITRGKPRRNAKSDKPVPAYSQDEEEVVAPAQGPSQAGVVMCPVCGDFEGDEAAVAHHVAGHFND